MCATGKVPNISNKDIADDSLKSMTGRDFECYRSCGCLERRKFQRPLLKFIRHDSFSRVSKCHGDGDSLVGVTPNWNRFITLDDGAIAEVLDDLQDRIIRIGEACVSRLKGRNLF